MLLISDPQADKAAAALDINIGSASDPADRQGLAHFLEHMLFLGTEKYPESGEYKAFISSHGGSDNAYTALEHTNYFFDIDKDHLEPALDRFAQFFIAPLFTERYVDRERQVVHSEYQSKLQSDGWRGRSAQKQAQNPKHPFTQFSVGSLETLADRPGSSIRQELIDFYRRHYSANLMTLVVLGKEPLPTLKQWVSEKFSAIENREAKPLAITEPLFTEQQLPAMIKIVPVKDDQRLSLSFPLPPLLAHYRTKPLSLISFQLGHEGPGSLLSLLKQRGWADSLWAGVSADGRDNTLFTVAIGLTKAGLQQTDTIISHVFQTLRLIEREGLQQWLYDEQQQLAEIDFRFQENIQPLGLVRGVAARLHDYPAEDVLRGAYALDEYKPELMRHYLQRLRPDNVFISLNAPGLEVDQVEPWFKARYALEQIDAATQKRWRTAAIDDQLVLAEPNIFIPQALDLQTAADGPDKPTKIMAKPGFELWHQHDVSFRVPKAEFYFSVRSPVANDTAEHAALTQLLVGVINDQLTEFTYPAYVAGLGYRLYKHIRGFTVRISGYNDKQDRLLEKILQTIKSPQITAERFNLVKDELIRGLKNNKLESPYQQAYGEITSLLLTPSWDDEQSLAALENLKAADLRDFIPQLFNALSITALAHGNIIKTEAEHLATMVYDSLLRDAEPTQVARGRLLKLGNHLGNGQDYIRELTIDHNDSALVMYLQGADKSRAGLVKFALLAQLIESPFFEDLRTENKLGYIVFASTMPLLQVPGLTFAVQSPIADPDELAQHIDRFLREYRTTLAALSDSEFAKHKQTLLARIQQKEKTLQDRSERYWTEIDRQLFDFDSREQLAAALLTLDKAQLLALYDQLLLADDRSRLLVRSVGQPHAERFAKKIQLQHQSADAAAKQVLRHSLIIDPRAFKVGREAFSG